MLKTDIMNMMHKKNTLNNDQTGFVAFFVTIMVMIIFGVLILSFSQISNREGVSALNRNLSTNALYAAESGINDAYTYERSIYGSSSSSGSSGTQVFSYSGNDQSYTVPSGVTSITVNLYGASGGSNNSSATGGLGAETTGTIAVTPGEILDLKVGGSGASPYLNSSASGGYPDGGAAQGNNFSQSGGGGGGSSSIWSSGTPLAIAGGGGGVGGNNGGDGGGGGSNQGQNGVTSASQYVGTSSSYYNVGGGGGTQSSGGRGSSPGSLYSGGAGSVGDGGGGGGGGGGYYGGGGGTGDTNVPSQGSGGGGGSSLTPSNGVSIPAVKSGNGQIIITPTNDIPVSQQTTYLNYTGSAQTYTVPSGVNSINVTLYGGSGGTVINGYQLNTNGGYGGETTGTITVTSGEVLTVIVAGAGGYDVNGSSPGGYGGGGSSSNRCSSGNGPCGAGGGGASQILLGTTPLAIAAGGGGAGESSCGDNGGGLSGVRPLCNISGDENEGTQTAGGAATASGDGTAGGYLTGGSGLNGGGGSGYYGGSGGDGASGGGGGGSALVPTGGTTTADINNGNGVVVISPSTSSSGSSSSSGQTTCNPSTYGNPTLSSNTKYTCLLVTSSPSNLQFNCSSNLQCPNNSIVTPIQVSGSNPINQIIIKWSDANKTNTGCSTVSPSPFLPTGNGSGDWPQNCLEVLRVDLVPFTSGTSTISSLESGAKTFFLYPQSSSAGSENYSSIPSSNSTLTSYPVYSANCPTTSSSCTFSVTNLAAVSSSYYARIQYYYGTSPYISITGTDINNNSVSFSGSQLQIDSTGLSGTVLKRVSASIELGGSSSSPYNLPLPPNYALQSTDSICKSLLQYQSNLYEIIPNSKPGDITAAPTSAGILSGNNNSDYCNPI
jgi:hypothetical protein